jgi:energy-coupling factor transporter ATP-binding protein EcfA2
MIEQLVVENLKSFGGRHEIELAPITLVYGPNSAGKSSLLQVLAILKQTLEPRAGRSDIDRPPLNLRGSLVDLGSFGAAIYRHDLTKHLAFGVQVSTPPPDRGRPQLRAGQSGYAELSFGFDQKTHAVTHGTVTIGIDEHHVRFRPARRPDSAMDPINGTERFFRVDRKADVASLDALLAGVLGRYPSDGQTLLDAYRQVMSAHGRPMFYGREFFPSSPWARDWRPTDTALTSSWLSYRIGDIVYGPAVAVISELSQLAYLGPLRAAPTRFQARSGAVYSSVGARGEDTPLVLLQERELIKPVNRWLANLGIHYTLEVASVETDAIGLEIGDLVVTRLIDSRSGIAVTPQDVGFGISQLLPVVVQSLAGRDRTICVEQPEIHIHPRLQSEIADLFIEAAEKHRNQMIIETHSEQLMLRLQRRIRDGTLTPDKVCVLYVDSDDKGVATAQRLRLAESGRFDDEWPNGFFAERLDELLPQSAPPLKRKGKTTRRSAQGSQR